MDQIKCAYCDSVIPLNLETCPFCNAPLKAEESVKEQDVQANTESKQSKSGTTAMVLGIISLACCWYSIGCIAGIVLGILALSKAKKYKQEYGTLDGKAKAGKITGLIGLIIGICLTLAYAVLLVFSIFIAIENSGFLVD